MTRKVVVLGAGMVGSVLAADLAGEEGLSVTVADRDEKALERAHLRWGLDATRADLTSEETLRSLAASADLVAGALPGSLGWRALETVIRTGTPCCDISFMPEDPWELDDMARENGAVAVVDMGVAPGMSNLLVGHAQAALSSVDRVAVYVGGLPAVRTLPFQYKAPFSPSDVIEEYVRPARVVENGALRWRPALSEPEHVVFPSVGTLEAFLTDGLRSLVHTVPARSMVEKTMRWPGHRELMLAFREAGFFGREPVELDGHPVRPVDLASRLLFPLWTYEEGEEDITVMRVLVTGEAGGKARSFLWDLLDRRDPESGFSSMARTTAFPAALAARLLLEGRIAEPGVHVPETLGRMPGMADLFLSRLGDKGVRFQRTDPGPEA